MPKPTPPPEGLDEAGAETLLRQRIREAGGHPAEWARPHGISSATLSNILSGRRRIGPRIAAALGLRIVRWFVSNRR